MRDGPRLEPKLVVALLSTGHGVWALAAVLAPLAANAGGGKPRNDCPPGFNLGSQSVQGYLQLPRTQAAVGADLISEAEVMAALISIDRNGNGNVCVDLSLGFEISSKPYVEYLYNVVDDNASVPS
jgi:hypothetical protein